ncbi:MAG: peptidase domain-containing ABC transporter [Bacteroidota bacterium]
MNSFPLYRQFDQMDCGPTCLRMVAKHHGRNYSLESLRKTSGINREGVSLLGISEAAEHIGFRTTGVKLTPEQLFEEAPLPCIVYWNKVHFVVVYKVKKDQVFIANPAAGKVKYSKEEFLNCWLNRDNENQRNGIALLLYTTPDFYERDYEEKNALNMVRLLDYVKPYKSLLGQLMLGLGVGSMLQLVFPFLTQSVVDIGINTRDISFITIILIAQIMLFISRTGVEFIRAWILLHMSTRINIALLSDFLIKLMKLPMSYFDTKMTGDIMQRMEDHTRIQNFLTGQTLSTLFSFVNLLVFAVVLAYYNMTIFGVFLLSSILYIVWVILFLKKRAELDHKRFGISSGDQSNVIQLIQGMQEIKLTNAEKPMRWEWERFQARLFKYRVKNLSLNQVQQAGAFFINEGKNIGITFLAAIAVVNGQLTLGAMMAIQYIIGQLNSPIQQIIGFVQSTQDALLSLERLNEIHVQEDEEPAGKTFLYELPAKKSLELHDLSFTYPGAGNEPVLKHIDLHIPEGKTTAIVGMSGSGKTTLLKLLLKFYPLEAGEIRVGGINLDMISHKVWRRHCGVVMQDGFIFSDTIARNIAVGEEEPDMMKLEHAVQVANIDEFIYSLPLGYHTKIGAQGNGISQGQKQRMLIARSVYKNPEFIFFDEATNALDANNERVILENLQEFFEHRTVVVVAHRLSTVKDAENIVVLDKGQIIEQGTHEELICTEGAYFELVRNQLELGG